MIQLSQCKDSGVNNFLLLDYRLLKMALRARKVSGAFETHASEPGFSEAG